MDIFLIFLMSCDSLLACLACGARGIRIPRTAAFVIAVTGTLCLFLSFALSQLLSALLPPWLFHFISCGALLVIALMCLFDEGARRLSARLAARCRPLQLRIWGLVLEIYADHEKADIDRSGTLSPAEALMLALPLSLDSLLTGLSIRVTLASAPFLLLFSLACGLIAVWIGAALGHRMRKTAGQSASILSGAFLFAIAIWKLLST